MSCVFNRTFCSVAQFETVPHPAQVAQQLLAELDTLSNTQPRDGESKTKDSDRVIDEQHDPVVRFYREWEQWFMDTMKVCRHWFRAFISLSCSLSMEFMNKLSHLKACVDAIVRKHVLITLMQLFEFE